MRPLMYVLGHCKPDSIQETHPWHQQTIDPQRVNPDLSIFVTGEKEALSARLGPLYHMFGGWKHYVLLEAEPPFHVGWIFNRDNQAEPEQSALSRHRIKDSSVRLLTGPEATTTQFFALNPEGEQILIRKIGKGVLGDNQFPDTRLL